MLRRSASCLTQSQIPTVVLVAIPANMLASATFNPPSRFQVPSPMLLHHLRRGGACTSALTSTHSHDSSIESAKNPLAFEQVAGRSPSDLAATFGSAASLMGQFKGIA